MKKYTSGKWIDGYGQGITGPNTPRIGNVTCKGSLEFDRWWSNGCKKDECPSNDYNVISKNMDTIAIVVGDSKDANSRLIAAAPELLEEHERWAFAFGEAIMDYLQGDTATMDQLARNMELDFSEGFPKLKSAAINKALGSE